MFGLEEVVEIIGYEVGGVCLFGLKLLLLVYCDVLLKVFDVVVLVVGLIYSVVCIMLEWMVEFIVVEWVDVCEVRFDKF